MTLLANACRTPVVDRRRRSYRRSRAGRRWACWACGLVLGGCAAVCDEYTEGLARHRPIAEGATLTARQQALLRPPRRPACEAEPPAKQEAGAAPNSAEANLALRIKLEYERECYRQAEMRVRRQLKALQAAVSEEVAALPQSAREHRSERPLE